MTAARILFTGNSKTARALEEAGRQMEAAFAASPVSPWREPLPTFRRAPDQLDIMQLMDRLNEANGSSFRNLPGR